jgi:hypothetical protein
MHKAIREGVPAIKAYYEVQNKDLARIVELVRGKIPKLVRKTCEAMVSQQFHLLCL